MTLLQLDTYKQHSRLVAVFALVVSVGAWSLELADLVYVCPYCRVQRTVIGILGLILLLPFASHWIAKYIALVVGSLGVVVGGTQHFMGWKKISAGEFSFADNIAIDPFLLSGLAVTMIIGLVALIIMSEPKSVE